MNHFLDCGCCIKDDGSRVWCPTCANPDVSSTVESVVLRTLEELSERGWCVVLKKLPPKIGWLIEGSRSEYDAPFPDKRVLPDTWACQATFIKQTNRWMFEQHAFSKSPQEAVARVAELCANEESRTGRDEQNNEAMPKVASATPDVALQSPRRSRAP